MFVRLIVSEEENGAVFQCEASSTSLEQPLVEQITLVVEFATSKVKVTGPDIGEVSKQQGAQENRPCFYHQVGEVLTFECDSGTSNPASSLHWVVDSRNMTANYTMTEGADHGGFVTKSNITVIVAEATRYKTVSCYADNLALSGEKSWATHRVTVSYPPDALIVSGYREGQVLQEKSLTKMKCSVWTGNPLPKLVWFRGKKKVEEQERTERVDADKQKISVSSEIVIAASREENGVKYKCKAKREGKKEKYYDDLTQSVKLTVHFLPKSVDITVSPEKLVENQLANLTCTSQPSNPPVDIYWQYNNKPLVASGNLTSAESKFNGYTTSSFVLMTLTTGHVEGKVECEARNYNNHSVFNLLALDVEYSPQFSGVPKEPVVVEVGGNMTVTVSAKANPAEIGFRWKKEGGAMVPTQGDAYSRWSHDGGTLTLRQVPKEDAGTYIVIANNTVGESKETIRVTVHYPATVVSISPEDPAISEGATLELRCSVDGNPEAATSVKWEKVGSKNNFTTWTDGGQSVLGLPPANTSTAGEYVCVANNGVPAGSPKEDRMSRFVKVKHAPIIDTKTTAPKVACDKEAEDCQLVCSATGWPEISTSWLRSGLAISKDDKEFEAKSEDKEDDADPITWTSKLTVKKVTSSQFGNYTCKVSNVYGESAAVISLEVSGVPDPPSQFKAVSATHSSITLSWKMDFTGGAKLEELEYRIRSIKEGAETYVVHEVPKGSDKFTVGDLQSATTYNFSILAQSSKGPSAYTTDIVQYKTGAAPAVEAAPAEPGAPPPEGGGDEKGGSGMLESVGGAAAILLLCNLALLVCYLRRRKLQEDEEEEESGGSSSILEMYLSSVSSSYGEGGVTEGGSSEDLSVDEDEEMDEETETRQQRRRSLRRAPAASSYAASTASHYPRYPGYPNPATSFPRSSPGYPRPSQGPSGLYRSPAWDRSAPLSTTRLGQTQQWPRY